MKKIKSQGYKKLKKAQFGPGPQNLDENGLEDPHAGWMDESPNDQDKCSCGSGLEKYPLEDARGIFVAYVCEKCENKVKAGYRSDIFEDGNYHADEQIEPEEEIGGDWQDAKPGNWW